MRVLIVGCGYVGLPLGAELVRQGHDVWGLRRSAAAAGELEAAGIRPLSADITRPETLASLPREFEWVIHCVAAGGGAEEYRRVYLEGTRNLLAWLAAASLKKFVYTSSTSVYGQNDGSIVDENSPASPDAGTARLLVETENILLAAARSDGLPAVILRVAGIYGPERGYWFRQFLKNEARLEGSGERFLNMIHRDDVVGCVLAALPRGMPGAIYNAVDDEPVRQRDFFAWLAKKLNRPLPVSTPANPGARRRGVTDKRVSNRKLKSELGYQFRYPDFRAGYAVEIERLESGEKFRER